MKAFKQHGVVLILAALVGLVCFGGQGYFMLSPHYAGISMLGGDADEHYLARMEAAYKGDFAGSNVFLPYKDQPYISPIAGETVTTEVGRLFGLSVSPAEMLGKFLFPFLMTLVLYALIFAMLRSRGAALFGAALVIIGDNLISSPSTWLGLLHASTTTVSFLTYSRPVNPEVSGLALFVGLLLLYRIFTLQKTLVWEQLLLGVIVGSCVYLNIYIYTFFGVWLIVCCGWFSYQRKWADALRAGGIGAIGLVCALPFLFNYHALRLTSAYTDSLARSGFLVTHAPIIGVWLLAISVLSLFALPKKYQQARLFFAISALSLLILTNQQILTGHVLQPGHYHWYITKPIASLMVTLLLCWGIGRFIQNQRIRIALWCLALSIIFYNAVLIQINSYRALLPQTIAMQAYAPVMASVNALPLGQVVMADRTLSLYIPIYTPADAPNNDYAMYYLVPQTYLEERLFLEYRLRGIVPAQALSTMTAERADIPAASMECIGVTRLGISPVFLMQFWKDSRRNMPPIMHAPFRRCYAISASRFW